MGDRRLVTTLPRISTLYYDMVYPVSQALCGAPGRKARDRVFGTIGLLWPSVLPRDILLSRRRMMPLGTHDMDKFTTITVEQRDAIEILSLNRPDALNAVTPVMADELIDYFSGLHDRLTTRIVIFRGNGRAFCAGAELGSDAFAAPRRGRPQRAA